MRPGAVLAAKGLRIMTVKPEFSVATTALVRPRPAKVRITFARDGRVRRADFLPGQDAGHPDVNGPLKDAIYRWRASGKELADLPTNDLNAGVTLTMRIVLN